ncbi:MAG TPA: deoxyribonuclease IV [Acidimicrobiia bacterium]|nr:deoxyribonuclease IV [Acidimicrobiia bacterium]
MMIGAHTANADPLAEAAARQADLVQIFLSNPQSWKKPNPRADAEVLRRSQIPIYVHSPYLVNVVAESSRIRIPSRKILQETCDAAVEIGAAGVIVHGGHLAEHEEIGEALPRWRKALESLDTDLPVLIENTAGGDNAVFRRLEVVQMVWDHIGDLGPGFVLDTCHAWAGGEPLDEIVGRIKATTGRIDLVHCNDSRDSFDSRRDRHANLGEGEIPADLLVQVVREAGAPVVVETPGDAAEHRRDIEWLRARL